MAGKLEPKGKDAGPGLPKGASVPFVGYRPKAPEPAAAAATTTPGIVKPVAASIDRGDDGASSDNQDDGDSDSDGSWKDDGDDSEDDYDDEGGARRRKGKKATKHRGVAGVTAGGSKGGPVSYTHLTLPTKA